MLVLDNIGRIPPPISLEGDHLWNRGFKVLLLGRGDSPRFLCKCRPPTDQWLARETEVRSLLCNQPSLQRVVPWTRGVVTDQVQLQLSRYVEGMLYEHIVTRLSLPKWVRSVEAILEAAELASSTYERLNPGTADAMELRDAAEPFFSDLRAGGLDQGLVNSLDAFLRTAGPLKPMIQHGDLWPRNVVFDGDTWWLLDFENFGEVRVPLYDVYHLLRTCVVSRRASEGPDATWFEHMRSGDALSRAAGRIVKSAADRTSVSADGAMAALVYYLVDVTGKLLRRRAPVAFCQSLLREVGEVAAAIRSGVDLRSVFWHAG